MPKLLVFGYGYTARRLGARILDRGWSVVGTRTNSEGMKQSMAGTAQQAEASRHGAVGTSLFQAIVFDGRSTSSGSSSSEVGAAIHEATHMLVSVPPSPEGDPVLLHHRPDLVAAPSLSWIGYLSTTGVYGDHGGRAVDEATPPRPGTERSRRRVEAEAGWREVAHRLGATLQIFRLAGIYGPGRSDLHRLRDGSARRIVAPDLVFNRIHVDDIVGVVEAGIDRPEVGGIFNVADDEPAPPSQVVGYAAAVLGMDPPREVPLDEADLSPGARSFYAESKRVGNRRLRNDLGYDLRFPTYREGIAAIASGEKE